MARPTPRAYIAALPPGARYLPDEGLYVCPDGKVLCKACLKGQPECYKVLHGSYDQGGRRLRYRCGHSGTRTSYVARLIARAFVPNPSGLDHVCHIDGNPLNDAAENLRWVSHRDAICNGPRVKQAVAAYGGHLTKTVGGVEVKDDETRAARRAYYATHKQIYLEANRRYINSKRKGA